MKKSFNMKAALILAVWMAIFESAMPAMAGASQNHTIVGDKSTAIVALPAGDRNEALVIDSARILRERLSRTNQFEMVDATKVTDVLGYHAGVIRREAQVGDAEKYLGLAKTHWFDRQYKEADATVTRAIEEFRKQKDKGALLLDALLTKAVIYQDTSRQAEAKKLFQEALKINPALTMEGLPIAGRSRRIFNATQREAAARLSGNLDIKSDPPVATVYLNGVQKGVTPLTLKGLTEGSYLLTLEASHYGKISEPVTVTANTTQFINRKLGWMNGQSGPAFGKISKSEASPISSQSLIKQAAQAGATLKVKNILLVGIDHQKTGDVLVVRSIDTTLQASRRPITVSCDDLIKNKTATLNKLVADLTAQAKVNVLTNPQESLDPKMGNIRVLRHKLPFYKTPLFYTLMGVVIGGVAGTTAGILLTRHHSSAASGAGGIDIHFQ